MADETRQGNDNGQGQRQRERIRMDKEARKEREYLREATVTIDVEGVTDLRAMDIIKAISERIGEGKILAVRPKQNKEYEVTLESEEETEFLMDGITINGMDCEVKRLQNRDYVVSFMHLPAYLDDREILNKLEGWGVSPISKIKRRVYPGTNIEDGTRFVKTRFPREVPSLPYSTKIETAEGPQYFRVMHSHQVKTCRLCMSPDHVFKDCPAFTCFKCGERGHFARNCSAVMCPDCKLVLDKCECWMESGGERQVSGQMHGGDSEQREEELNIREETGTEQRDKCNEQRMETRNEGEEWTQMVLTDSLQSILNIAERKEQRDEDLSEAQKETNLCSQMVNLEGLPEGWDNGEEEEQRSKELGEEKEQEEKKEEAQTKVPKRRRSLKFLPNIETARKKALKETEIESKNKFEVLTGLEDMN
ncbi:hypothetical protein M9458_057667 [Cirrhinus mrigala]|uniref:CCHC-type domain-containing protein n=1 Tax=Cirrhinus mrigala TaxID=683832 RepID=A0ABD0MAY1_CIRMR